MPVPVPTGTGAGTGTGTGAGTGAGTGGPGSGTNNNLGRRGRKFSFIAIMVGRRAEERVHASAAPTGSTPTPAVDIAATATSAWAHFLSLDSEAARSIVLSISPLHASLLAVLARLAASTPPGEAALFEWPWLEQQFATVQRSSSKTQSAMRPTTTDGASSSEPSLDEGDDALRQSIIAGKRLLARVRLFSLGGHGHGWDGATLLGLAPRDLLALAQIVSAGRFLTGGPPPAKEAPSGGSLRARSVKWLAELEVVHVGALLVGWLDAALWQAHRLAQGGSGSSTALRELPAHRMWERSCALRPLAAARRANGGTSMRQAAMDALRREGVSEACAACARVFCARGGGGGKDGGSGSGKDGGGGGGKDGGGDGDDDPDDGWFDFVLFPPLRWCVRFAHAARGACAARLLMESKAAENAADRLLRSDPDSTASGGGGDAGCASEAKRRKRERQQQRKREQQQQQPPPSTPPSQPLPSSLPQYEAGEATSRQRSEGGSGSTSDTDGLRVAQGGVAVVGEIIGDLVEASVLQAVANAAARRKERQALHRQRREALEAATAAVEAAVSAALRDALRREKKRARAVRRQVEGRLVSAGGQLEGAAMSGGDLDGTVGIGTGTGTGASTSAGDEVGLADWLSTVSQSACTRLPPFVLCLRGSLRIPPSPPLLPTVHWCGARLRAPSYPRHRRHRRGRPLWLSPLWLSNPSLHHLHHPLSPRPFQPPSTPPSPVPLTPSPP